MDTRLGVMLCAAACCGGCGERHAGVDVAPDIVAQVRLGSELVSVDASRHEIAALDVLKRSPTSTVSRLSVPAHPRLAVERSPGKGDDVVNAAGIVDGEAGVSGMEAVDLARLAPTEILVLSDGSKDEGGDYVDRPTLSVIASDHQVRHYELSVPFRQLTLSQDARFALLWGQVTQKDDANLLDDPNRVAVVDLDAPASTANPFERTLKSSGGNVVKALITPAMNVGANANMPRPMGLFSFNDGLSIWDLTNPAHEDITVAVDRGSGAPAFSLKRLLADAANGKLCMVLEGEKVLRVLSFIAATGASNDFGLSWNQLPLDASGANDMVLYGDPANRKVLVAIGSSLGIIDVNNSTVARVALSTPADHLYTYWGASPNDNDIKQRVLAWGTGQSVVSFVDLTNLEKGGSQNIEPVRLGGSVEKIIRLQSDLMLTVLQSGGTGTLELESQRAHPVSSTVALSAPLIESDARRVWVAGGNEDSRIGFFEPAALRIGSLRLDAPVQQLFLFEDASQRRVVATHPSAVGEVSIVDATKATRASTSVITGYLLDGWVSR
jgi:hypothetical protein